MTATPSAAKFGRGARFLALGMGIALAASACGGTSSSPGTSSAAASAGEAPLKIGSLLPATGSLSFLGPPEVAGVNLAISEINAAGGVLGEEVEVIHRDSGDTTTDIATQSVTDLLNQGASAVLGAASSGVTKTVIGQITGAGVVQLSPANTAQELTDWDDDGLFWRTAPSDVLQGRVLGNYMVSQGAQSLGMIVLNDAYGTGLQSNIKEAFEGAGGEIVAESLFNEGDSQFSSQVDQVVAAQPDAIALISFVQAKTIIPLLLDKGIKPSQIYMVDGNMNDYSKDFAPGTLEGAQGTIPGTFAKEEFKAKLAQVDPALTSWSYAGESYDGVNMIALAAMAAESTNGKDIAGKLKDVSEGGEKCSDFASCSELLKAGEDIDYDGISGPITFSEKGDPTEAYIGIYKFDGANVPQPLTEEFGQLTD
jgi:branched-chain amino acid transport system substrate-binding protein